MVDLPATMPHRTALAVAAGAGPQAAQTVWDVLDPTWAQVRTHLGRRPPNGPGRTNEERLRRRWAAAVAANPTGISPADPPQVVLRWRHLLAVVGAAAPTPRAPQRHPRRVAAVAAPRWWVSTRRLRRQAAHVAARDAGRGVLDRPVDHHTSPRDLARWGVALAEQPALLTRTLTMGSYPLGTPPAAPDGGPGDGDLAFYAADLCAAVIGATLARGGPDAVHTGLTLATTGSYGLAELCAVVAEVTPGADPLRVSP